MPTTRTLPQLAAHSHADAEKAAPHFACGEDRHLAERIEHALRATGYGPLRAVEVSVSGHGVRLAGRVPSFFLKQIAQVTARAVPGTHQISNELDVTSSN